MPTTITGYNTFAANTKARASEMNANFSNHRGTLLPINTNTATASDSSHDLGSTEHRWRDLYADSINLQGATSTANLQLVPNTAVTAGGWDLQAGTTTGKCLSWGASSADLLLYGTTIATFDNSKINLLINGATAAAFNSNGISGTLMQTNTVSRDALAAPSYFTGGASGQNATWSTGTSTTMPGMYVSVTCYATDNKINVGFESVNTTAGAVIGAGSHTTTSNNFTMFLYRGSTIIREVSFECHIDWVPDSFRFIDHPNTTGSVTYSMMGGQIGGAGSISINYLRMTAYHI